MTPENEETTGVAMPQEEVSVVSQSPVERDYTQETNDRCKPMVLAILGIISRNELPLDLIKNSEEDVKRYNKMYLDMTSEVQALLQENNIGYEDDLNQITRMMEQVVYVLMEAVKGSANINYNMLKNALFGFEDNEVDNRATLKSLSDLTVRRQKIREAVKLILAEPFVPEVK